MRHNKTHISKCYQQSTNQMLSAYNFASERSPWRRSLAWRNVKKSGPKTDPCGSARTFYILDGMSTI